MEDALRDLLYPALSVPFLGGAFRCWRRWATGGSWAWLLGGVLLAACGVDGLRLLWERVEESPNPLAGLVMMTILGGAVFWLLLTQWRALSRPRGEV